VQPSSLVFLVIIAIWAAYLLQHWVRRREQLATARSVDRFSEAMRVLDRRSALPESPLTAAAPRSYAVSPARPSRPEVVVNRAPSPGRPLASAAARPRPRGGSSAATRRLRGLTFLGSLALLLVSAPLAGLGLVGWWSSAVALGLLLADLAWLRRAARAERSRRPARAGRQGGRQGGRQAPVAPARRPASTPDARPAAAPGAASPTPTASPVEDVEGTPVADPDGWKPVPVPPPTYTLKAKAAQPQQPARATAPAEATSPASFGGVVAEGELDGLLDRRRAAGA
jgi:membrane protein implicated in regulation of membrane protease activity